MSRFTISALAFLLVGTAALVVAPPPAASDEPTSCATASPPPPSSPSTEAAARYGWGSPRATDEFNYVGAPDKAVWSVYNSAGHSGKGLRRPSQVTVDGQVLRMTGLPNGTTAGMSARLRGTTYGRWEVRMRVPSRSVQYHPVLIVWPDKGRTAATNYMEIDFSEGSDLGYNKFFLHAAKGSSGQTHATIPLDQTVWHNYAVEWQRGRVTGYIDGVKWFEDTGANAAKVKSPAHLTMQLDWFPNSSKTATSTMEVDWVRTYRP